MLSFAMLVVGAMSIGMQTVVTLTRYVECCYAECHYDECCYADLSLHYIMMTFSHFYYFAVFLYSTKSRHEQTLAHIRPRFQL